MKKIDPMMEELHKIREKNSKKIKTDSLGARTHRLLSDPIKFLSSYGFHLVPTGHGTHRLVRGV